MPATNINKSNSIDFIYWAIEDERIKYWLDIDLEIGICSIANTKEIQWISQCPQSLWRNQTIETGCIYQLVVIWGKGEIASILQPFIILWHVFLTRNFFLSFFLSCFWYLCRSNVLYAKAIPYTILVYRVNIIPPKQEGKKSNKC